MQVGQILMEVGTCRLHADRLGSPAATPLGSPATSPSLLALLAALDTDAAAARQQGCTAGLGQWGVAGLWLRGFECHGTSYVLG